MDWEVIIVEPVLSWLHQLRQHDRPTLIQISKAITALQREGPATGRPLVDTVKGSRLANLKELRPGSAGGSEVRLLFVFDPLRRAVFLVGGDKAGEWQGWYRVAIPQAEAAYEDYVTQLEEDPQ
ncbi:type II toxin-antitoxin system RelE/ParE family toxin [Streptomyces sp. NBC_01006]|uniref:type II toxin-antitoxin system RelE/ParE family toxin n=1 Tax=Streptomyces sp. NBC_01006 TaxID=2903716 RepID=UPI00386DDFF9|nr:type II toxin-antitoxin system RelE/ParE family toxin [Streptomyces sp. NBC_01006]